jgi:hypothetical protein
MGAGVLNLGLRKIDREVNERCKKLNAFYRDLIDKLIIKCK